MKQKEAKRIANGKVEINRVEGVKIVTPGNGGSPLVPDDVVRAELVIFPSEVEIKGADAELTTPVTVIRSDVVRFLRAQAPSRILRQFNLVFPEGLTEKTSLADRWRRFKRTNRKQRTFLSYLWHVIKGDSHKC